MAPNLINLEISKNSGTRNIISYRFEIRIQIFTKQDGIFVEACLIWHPIWVKFEISLDFGTKDSFFTKQPSYANLKSRIPLMAPNVGVIRIFIPT